MGPAKAEGESAKTWAVDLTRVIRAPRHRVFAAFTEAEDLKKWFGPEGFTTPVAQIEPKPGAAYRIEMRSPEGNTYRVGGVLRQVEAPDRVVLTWIWEEGEPTHHETLVTVTFRDLGGDTEVRLIHDLFPSERARDQHHAGWTSSLACLERAFEGGESR